MTKQKIMLWQVSVTIECKRKYYQFTTLKKALRFMDYWIVAHIDTTNTYPADSVNLMIREFKKAPNNIDQVL